MSLSIAPTDKAREEAADWFARLKRRDVPAADLEAHRLWYKAPDNKAAYDELDAFWRQSQAVKADPDIQAAIQAARDRANASRSQRRAILGLGVAVASTVVAGVIGWRIFAPQAYSTAIGEQQLVQLPDGSSVKLDTASRISVRMSGDRRDIRLERGRALFEVAHDAERPFVVLAGKTSVTALGTRFDVSRDGDGARVNLIKGSVEVRAAVSSGPHSWRLAPGQGVSTVDPAPAPRAVDVAAATSWTSGRLIFQASPLDEAVAEVNRYNRVRIVLDVGGLAKSPVSGAFDAGDTETFAHAMAELNDLAIERPAKDEIRLTSAGAHHGTK